MRPPLEDRIRLNGIELYARTVGAGPEIIVLHGGPGAHHDYLLPQFDGLAPGHTLRYYDQRGGGRSAVPRDVAVGWKEHVEDLDALLDYWSATPATLLGYSWGGLLAMLYAVNHPRKVGRLALVSAAAATHGGREEFERRFAERMRDPRITEERERLRASGLRERDPKAYRQRAFELSVAAYFRNPALAHDLTPFRVTGRTQEAVWESLGDYDLSSELSALTVPTLMVHGRYDPVPLTTAERTAKLLNARLEIFESSGHVPYVEEYDRFINILQEFLPSGP